MRWLKVGVEDAFGNALTSSSGRLRGVRVTSLKPSIDQGVLVDETIEDYLPPAAVGGALKVGWSVEMSIRPNQVTEILEALMGVKSTSGVAAPYTHTFTLGKPKSLTLYAKEEEGIWRSAGVGVKSMELKMNAREIVTASLDCVAKDIKRYDVSTSIPDPEFSSEDPFVFYEATVLVDGVTLATCKEASLSIDRGIADDEFVLDDYTLAALKAELTKVKGKLKVQQEELSELRRALFGSTTGDVLPTTRAIGNVDLVLKCVSGSYSLQFEMPVALYEKVEWGWNKRDRIEREIDWEAVGSVTVTLVNDVA